MKRYTLFLIGLLLVIYCPIQAQTIQVMSYNIHHGTNKSEINTLKEMALFIKNSGADLVGLQEVDSMCNRSGREDQMKKLGEITGMHYAFVRHFAYDGGAYGLGILSKYPISKVKNDTISSAGKNGEKKTLALLSANIALSAKNNVVFATVHLGLDQAIRIKQSSEVVNYLKENAHVILTGDLNAEPTHQEIVHLREYFTSISREGSIGYTFPDSKAVKKIDYILVSNLCLKKVISSKVNHDIHYSDHLPIIGKFIIQK